MSKKEIITQEPSRHLGIEVFRIIMESVSKLALPIAVVVILFMFKPQLDGFFENLESIKVASFEAKSARLVAATTEGIANELVKALETGGVEAVRAYLDSLPTATVGARDTIEPIKNWMGWSGTQFSNKANFERLSTWLTANGLEGSSVVFFLGSTEMEPLRVKAISDLGII